MGRLLVGRMTPRACKDWPARADHTALRSACSTMAHGPGALWAPWRNKMHSPKTLVSRAEVQTPSSKPSISGDVWHSLLTFL